ncbi:amidohydrolase [Corynebacterium sp. sy017]|uniref:amidohydrolase n=1 Tax=unclassified Corynebacterium TaxID=2624378 RepID=UPI001185DE8E|nr:MULTISPECIES: amidohydrolase [unclassified Corynebacterium]MBP3087890.1 amidohydrolase [Corynebacterium sp. sy017]QDZ42858.1 amidohydrolase [Corynebacterium sp. sy039]TSD92431.1 amidohydrolase [Corynebacterium sp. SY003]
MNIVDILGASTLDLRWQWDVYRHLHAHPELSGRESKTAAYILKQLEKYNCEVISGIGGHGIVAIFRNGDGASVLMRADFDGLPVKELTGVAFASRDIMLIDDAPTPTMHACGHDMHTTSLLGVCAFMDAHRMHWSGTFIALFQPSEENGKGAETMVADGLTSKIPQPDVCFGQHITAGRAGTVMTMPGAALATCDSIEIKITGHSAHGSMPHNAIDPTYAAAMIVIRIQGIVGREIAPHDFAVASVGTLQSGRSNNTIPGEALIVINCRTYSEKVKKKLYSAIERVAKAECAASGMKVQPAFRYFGHGPLTTNNPHVFARVRPQLDAVFGENSLNAQPWTASEDFSNIPDAFGVPYLFWTVGCTPAEQWDKAVAEDNVETTIPVNHMGTFLPDYQPTITACNNAALTAILSYLKNS